MQHLLLACLAATDQARLLLLELCWELCSEPVSQPAGGLGSFSNHRLVSCTCLPMHSGQTQHDIMRCVIKDVRLAQ